MKARNWIAPIAALCCALGWGAVALAGGNAATLETKTECFGYYNLRMPGGVEWPFTPAMRLTPDSVISTWFKGIDTPTRTRYFVDTGGIAVADDWGPDRIAISESATSTELKAVIANLHEKKDYEKKLLLEKIVWFGENADMDESGEKRKRIQKEAAAIPYYIQIPISQLEAYGLVEGKYLTFFVLYEGRILQTRRLLQGSPADTVQAFLSHIRPRAVYDVPGEPGSCLPALFVTGEKSPSRITGTFRLRDMPEIGVKVSIYPAGPETKAETEDILKKAVGPLHPVKPFSRLRPLESVVADGNKGYGVYFYRESAVVTKSMPRPTTPDIDMAFIARIPGNPTLPKGKTFTLGIEINRYGLHAKEPMSEKEFRKIVTSIMQGITMRPGAWQELSP